MALSELRNSALQETLRPWLDRLDESGFLYSLAKGTFWSLTGMAAARLCGLATTVVTARILGTSGYGEFGVVQGTVGMFSVLAGFGLAVTTSRHIAEFKRTDPVRAGRLIGTCLIASAVSGGLMAAMLAGSSDWLASTVLNSPRLGSLLAGSAITLIFGSWSGVQTGALAGFEAFRGVYRINLYTGLISLPLSVAGVLLWGISGAVAAMVAVSAAGWAVGNRILRRELNAWRISVSYTWSREDLGVLWRFSLPSLLSGLLVSPVFWACTAMLANEPLGYAELGILNAANQWRLLSLSIPGVVLQVALPIMAGSTGRALRGQVLQTLRLNLASGGGIFAILSLLSPVIMALYGPDFFSRWPVFVAAQIVTFVQALQAPVVAYWVARGEMWGNFAANLLWAGAVLLLSWLLLDLGAMGLMLGLLGGFLVFSVPLAFRLRKLMREA